MYGPISASRSHSGDFITVEYSECMCPYPHTIFCCKKTEFDIGHTLRVGGKEATMLCYGGELWSGWGGSSRLQTLISRQGEAQQIHKSHSAQKTDHSEETKLLHAKCWQPYTSIRHVRIFCPQCVFLQCIDLLGVHYSLVQLSKGILSISGIFAEL